MAVQAKLLIASFSVLGISAGSARAGTTNASSAGTFVAPTQWLRGSTANSAYALWDNSFTSLTTNLVLFNGSNLTAANVMAEYPAALTGWNASDANAGSITSTQHIYGAGQANLALSVVIPNYGLGSGYTTFFRVQSSTATLALDAASFSVSADGAAAVAVTPEVTNLGGGSFSDLYTFELPGNASSYVLYLSTPTSGANFKNTALNALSVDTVAAVPEPGTAMLAAAGALLSVARRRRRTA